MWNASASAERMRALIEIIERHAAAVGRDASRIEKSVLLPPLLPSGTRARAVHLQPDGVDAPHHGRRSAPADHDRRPLGAA